MLRIPSNPPSSYRVVLRLLVPARWPGPVQSHVTASFPPFTSMVGGCCLELRAVNGGQYTHPVITSVTLQNTDGGAFHWYNLKGGEFSNSAEWDTLRGGMTRDILRLGNGTTGFVISGLGVVAQPLGAAVLAPGRHLVAIGRGSSNMYTPATAGVVWTGLNY